MNTQTLYAIDYNGGQIWVDQGRIAIKGEKFYFLGTVIDRNDDNAKAVQTKDCHPIIAQSLNLFLPNIPYVEIDEDIEQIALAVNRSRKFPARGGLEDEFVEGYKAASAKKYTENDLRKAFGAGVKLGNEEVQEVIGRINQFTALGEDEYIQSLNPKPVSIEVEATIEWWDNNLNSWVGAEDDDTHHSRVVPVTYTKDGKTFLKVLKVNYASTHIG